MSTKQKSENTWLDALFQEDAVALFTQTETRTSSTPEGAVLAARFQPPTLPQAEPAAEAQQKVYWKTLRAFFRTGKGGGLPTSDGKPDCYPALLAPYIFKQDSGPYPCWIGTGVSGYVDPTIFSIRALLEQILTEFAPGDAEAVILKDNLPRLERIVKNKCAGTEAPLNPRPLLDEALDELVLQLDLKGKEGESFLADINQFRKILPDTGTLIPLSPLAPFELLNLLLDFHTNQQKQELKKIIEPLQAQLRQLLAVENSKKPEARSAAKLEANLDFAGSFLNFDELAAVLPAGGSVAMPEERLHRIEQILQTLENAEAELAGFKPNVLVAERLEKKFGMTAQDLFPQAVATSAPDSEAFKQIANLYDQKIQACSTVFAAIRIARLELDEQYQHDVHGDLFAYFTHADFNEAELALCPAFILLVHGADLLHVGLNDFSALLASNRPVKCLALKFDAFGHVSPPDKSGKVEPVFRQEPGALAVAHRDAYVLQTSVADPQGLYEGFWDGLHNPAPAFFYVLSAKPNRQLPGGDLVWASAALGGREFPYFTFDNRKGPKWGSRFDIQSNPDPESDWPTETLLYIVNETPESKPSLFTFADFAALDPAFERFFNPVPPEQWTDDLVPLADYLQAPVSEAYRMVPFIWVVDSENRLQKAAVAFPLVQTCLERRDFWHFLQENAGVHSFHVEQATDQLRRELDVQLEQKLAELEENHRRQLEQVREESTRQAMEQLAGFLLDLDVSAIVPTNPDQARTAQPEATVQAPGTEPAPAKETATSPAAEASVQLTTEAWIDTPLCTTCNECTNLNDRIFKYNADKQAYVADPAGGPFADIVKAAEECPVSIIHPGTPHDPKEPGLDALIKRAAKFN